MDEGKKKQKMNELISLKIIKISDDATEILKKIKRQQNYFTKEFFINSNLELIEKFYPELCNDFRIKT